MDDITVRLRRGFGGLVPTICDEAANEIERFRRLIDAMIIECSEDMPHKAIWLASRNGEFKSPLGSQSAGTPQPCGCAVTTDGFGKAGKILCYIHAGAGER